MVVMHSTTDWESWHTDYDDPSSLLSERLRLVQRYIADWLDVSAPRPVTVLSLCAGDGRDLLEVLEDRTDAGRVTATLIEADVRNAARATEHVVRLNLSSIEVRCTDAGTSNAYHRAVPADLVLLCGIFGNIADDDVQRTIAATPQLCNENAVVIWTRHRRDPDLTPHIREWFRGHGLEEEHFDAPDHAAYSVGVHRFVGEPKPLDADQRLLTFIK
ncbi:SAM-dependent methyltransferase [Nocardioides sp.]|uniref:SAM-dependent methyltransferase n=1 Tax=Nocardioides sp. TaxID=35761 RepID=UPI0026039B35|nr:SAM-dependent methyltransferase [Nocardioides sp.]MDI6908933.1 SAM-dependent methyltransferase [Nocardioides sp.]